MNERVRLHLGRDIASSENGKESSTIASERARERELRAEIEESGEIQIMQNLVYHRLELVFYFRNSRKSLKHFSQVEAAFDLLFKKSLWLPVRFVLLRL